MYRLKLNNALVCGLLLFLLALHIPLPHPPGSGLYLPTNIIAWLFMAFISLLVFLAGVAATVKNTALFISPFTGYMGVATVMLALPLLYTPGAWQMAGFIQWAGIAGGFIFCFCLAQGRLTFRHHRLLLTGLATASLIQASVGALYLLVWLPSPAELFARGPQVGGILLQQNITGTFLILGLGASMLLWLEPLCRRGRVVRLVPPAAMVVIPFMLVFLQSRIGTLNGVLLLVCFGLLYGRREPRRCAVVFGCVLLGVILGNILIWFAPNEGVDLVHEASNSARIQILQNAWRMIELHPVIGWGLGSFSYQYARFMVASGIPVVESLVTLHPHNEWLYGWVEGGIVTVVAYLLLLIAGWKLWKQALRRDRLQNVAYRRGLWILLLPLLLHTQVEYPFYLSAVLWMICLLLLALVDGVSYGSTGLMPAAEVETQYCVAVPRPAWLTGSLLGSAAALLTLVFMATGLQSGLVLTQLEQLQMAHPGRAARTEMSAVQHAQWNPWIFDDRFEFDRQVNHLLSFNVTRDPQLLAGYLTWSSEYLVSHINPDVLASRMMILAATGHRHQAQRIRAEAHLLYPRDGRFNGEPAA